MWSKIKNVFTDFLQFVDEVQTKRAKLILERYNY